MMKPSDFEYLTHNTAFYIAAMLSVCSPPFVSKKVVVFGIPTWSQLIVKQYLFDRRDW